MKVIGLTGGIGCGKSTVGAMLSARGLPVVDADAVARDVVAPGMPALARLVERFGDGILREDEGLDRAAMAQRVFGDDEARRDLEAITHPAIAAETGRRFAALARSGHRLAVYEAPLLFEAGRADAVHEVVAVVAPQSVQLARLTARGDLDEEQARARMAAQLPTAEKARRAHVVIDNSGDRAALRRAVDALLTRWIERGWWSPPTKEAG